LDLRDRDLISIQEARDSVARAVAAQKKFAVFSQQQVDSIVEACAAECLAAGESLARIAVEETGFGNVPDKTTKNRLASQDLPRAMAGMRTIGTIREDRDRGIIEVATPVGVVAAVIPSTNPTSTAIYKSLISLKSGNAIVMSPHPSAARCICETAATLERAAVSAGCPEGLINCMRHTTLAGTRELMSHRDVGVILATGGTGLVRAAYSSGKPAYGVGPGNVPAFIERTADVRKAVADIFAGKTFDYGTICSSEQAIVTEEAVREAALDECLRQGAYFLSAEESQRIGDLVFLPGARTPNTDVVGRAATTIAQLAGIQVPSSTRVLIARLEPEQVGRAFPLSAEKLSPILALYSVANLAAGIEMCQRLLAFGGLGHTCAIHSQNEPAIRKFGQAVPAFRVCVNTSAVHGAIGYSTNLFPAMTLGCGAPGGNITSDNIGPQHLINVKRIAWESRPVEHRSVPADQRVAVTRRPEGAKPVLATAASASFAASPARSAVSPAARIAAAPTAPAPAGEPSAANSGGVDRARIADLVAKILTEYKIAAGSGLAVNPEANTSAASVPLASPAQRASIQNPSDEPSPSEIASKLTGRVFGAALPRKPDAVPAAASPKVEAPTAPPAPKSAPVPKLPPVSSFVSESDVRRAMAREEKIYIGPKTIVTPSARDLGNEHEVFIETPGNAGSKAAAASPE
jgi:acetaldehyde dehydrogenase (acetylating)